MLQSSNPISLENTLQKTPEVLSVEPANLLVGDPEPAGLVDVDPANLLGIRLPELLAYPEGIETCLEDASLAEKVGCAAKSEGGSDVQFSLVQEMAVRIIGEIERLALPTDLEALGIACRKSVDRRAEVRQSVEVHVIADGRSTDSLRPNSEGRVKRVINPLLRRAAR